MNPIDQPVNDRPQTFDNFAEFYPYYLSQHRHTAKQYMHLVGASLGILMLIFGLFTLQPLMLILVLVFNILFAWHGHFLIEGNHPVSFRHPLYSFLALYVMSYHIFLVLLGRRRAVDNPQKEDPLIAE